MMKKILAVLSAVVLLLGGYAIVVELPGIGAVEISSGGIRKAVLPAGESVSHGDTLGVHFLDVGQADCILLECGGEFMLIDGGNRADGQLVVSYLEQQGVERLKAVVCTHAHEDHVGGLPSVMAVFPVDAVYAPTDTYASSIYDDFLRYVDQQRLKVTIPNPGDTITLGGTKLTVLGPVKDYPDPNNTSIVLRAEYGDTSFLFTGDMETEAEGDMLDYWGDAMSWRTDVLKVGHHCSNSSTSYRLLYMMIPKYAVIPVGKGNDYGHPHKEPVERLEDAGAMMLRTDKLGTVVAQSNGGQVMFTWANQSAQPDPVDPANVSLVGNRNSKMLHSSSCENLPAHRNWVVFEDYDAAIGEGYLPCRSCLAG